MCNNCQNDECVDCTERRFDDVDEEIEEKKMENEQIEQKKMSPAEYMKSLGVKKFGCFELSEDEVENE